MDPLELKFTNGEGEFRLPKEAHWAEESEFQIDLILEDVRKRPAKIQNDAQEEIYKEKMGKIRLLENAIRKEVNERRDPINALLTMITSASKPALQSLATESKAILDEITHWESHKRLGFVRQRQKAEEKIAAEAEKLAQAKTSREKAAAKRKIEQFKREGGIVSAGKPTSHGVAIMKRWKGKLVNPTLFFKSKFADDGFVECELNQQKINEHCKEIIRNGGTITGNTLPGIELTEEIYSQWRG